MSKLKLSFDDKDLLLNLTRGYVGDYFITLVGCSHDDKRTTFEILNYNMYVTDTLNKAMLVAEKGNSVMDASFSDLQCVTCPKIAAVAKMLDMKNHPITMI